MWGIAVAGPVALALLKKRLRPADPVFFCLLVLGGSTLYIARVGGDVLRNWRFFVPVLFAFYFVLTEGIGLLPLPRRVGTLLLLALVPLTFIGPFTRPRTVREEIVHNLALERDLVTRMTRIGLWLNTRLGPDDWFAATTIGAVSFYSDRNMIDMLGLTDRVIAHEPERILATTWYWRERNYNTAHVLGRTPAFICFSTGVRPSAEAERALFLRPRFRRGYFPALVTITGQEAGRIYHSFETLFQARPDTDTIPLEPVAEPTRFVDSYVDAIGRIRFDRDSAAALLRRCIAEAPEDFGAPWEWLGHVEELRGNPALAVAGFEEALRRDDRLLRAHLNLAVIRHDQGDIAAAVEHMRRVVEYAPDYLDGYTNLAALLVILEQYDAAEELLLRARARFPLIPEIESRLAWTRSRSGR